MSELLFECFSMPFLPMVVGEWYLENLQFLCFELVFWLPEDPNCLEGMNVVLCRKGNAV